MFGASCGLFSGGGGGLPASGGVGSTCQVFLVFADGLLRGPFR